MIGLLELYEKYIKLDPYFSEKDYEDRRNYLISLSGGNQLTRFDTLNKILTNQATELSNYYSYRDHAYWKSTSGKKVLTNDSDIFASLDPWWPTETFLFDILRGSLTRVLILELLKEKYNCTIPELYKYYNNSKDIVSTVLPELESILKAQNYWCFYMGDPRNSIRKKPVKIRQVKITNLEIRKAYYTEYFMPTIEDLKTKETRKIIYTDGWNFYITKEHLKSRLTDIGNYWMKTWDHRVEGLGREIKSIEKQLQAKKDELTAFQGSISDYNKSINNILWKDF